MRCFLIIPFDDAKSEQWFVNADDKSEAVRALISALGEIEVRRVGDLLVSEIPLGYGVYTTKRLKTWACNLTGIKPSFYESFSR